MERYPLAVYTARHGLAWTYDRAAIPFAALDACRKAFGALPDFDAGEPGFEGVWATAERVFAVRCQSAPAWDFRGRDATYLAVTWVPRGQAANTDFEALLASPTLRQPTHTPPANFLASAACPAAPPRPATPLLPEGFTRAGAVIAGLPPGAAATFRRALGERAAQVRVAMPPVPARNDAAARRTGPERPGAHAEAVPPSPPPNGLFLPWPVVIAAAVALLLSLGLSGWLAYDKWATPRAQPPPSVTPFLKLTLAPFGLNQTIILSIERHQGAQP